MLCKIVEAEKISSRGPSSPSASLLGSCERRGTKLRRILHLVPDIRTWCNGRWRLSATPHFEWDAFAFADAVYLRPLVEDGSRSNFAESRCLLPCRPLSFSLQYQLVDCYRRIGSGPATDPPGSARISVADGGHGTSLQRKRGSTVHSAPDRVGEHRRMTEKQRQASWSSHALRYAAGTTSRYERVCTNRIGCW